jgi:hypothetical protein
MRGAIHGIWFTQPSGKLHPNIIPNLSSWVSAAAANNFTVVLWTNTNEIVPDEIAKLRKAGIEVADHSLCKTSPLYKYFNIFLAKGIKGDNTAFALASDILRMAILDLTANNEYFIYVDPNDIQLHNLNAKLKRLHSHMDLNSLGYAFNVEPTPYRADMFDTRNDVLIALKQKNPEFFRDYLNAYLTNLANNHTKYVKPTTDRQAQDLENLISNQTSAVFFQVNLFSDNSIRVVTSFANYHELYQLVNTEGYLQSQRLMQHGNTWLPIGELKEELEELAQYNIFPENLPGTKNHLTAATPSQLASSSSHIPAVMSVLGVLILLSIIWLLAKNRTKVKPS